MEGTTQSKTPDNPQTAVAPLASPRPWVGTIAALLGLRESVDRIREVAPNRADEKFMQTRLASAGGVILIGERTLPAAPRVGRTSRNHKTRAAGGKGARGLPAWPRGSDSTHELIDHPEDLPVTISSRAFVLLGQTSALIALLAGCVAPAPRSETAGAPSGASLTAAVTAATPPRTLSRRSTARHRVRFRSRGISDLIGALRII